MKCQAVDYIKEARCLVDDIYDSGATAKRLTEETGLECFYLVDKRKPEDKALGWIVFPWEVHDLGGDIKETVVRQLQYMGEDPNRDGLRDTPARVVRAQGELTEGYGQDPKGILSKTFEAPTRGDSEMIIVEGIDFYSLCEHHLLPFHGKATVAYIPKVGGRVVGLSKIPRLVNCFSRRLQLQERLTDQIASTIAECLDPIGAGCVIRAHHTCMSMRGVRSQARMTTSALYGVLNEDPKARAEFMSLAERSLE